MPTNNLSNFHACYDILSSVYNRVNGEDFYRYIFPDNENMGELHSDFSHPNAIFLYQDEQDEGTDRRLRRRIMFSDTWSADYMDYVEGNSMTLCSGLSFLGKENKLEKAAAMNALVFDLDGVGERELQVLFERMTSSSFRSIPEPTFLVLSGRGVHLYYVFNEPIPLYPNIKLQLKSLKHDLTYRIWEYRATSQYESVQYQSIGQGFRMVGSVNNKYGNTVTAFQIGGRVSLAYLNSFVPSTSQVDLSRPFRPSQVDRATAAELYPEWYQRVVVEGDKRLKKWNIGYRKRTKVKDYALYDWWIKQIVNVKGGHRYFFLMCLVIYACKCDVSKEQLKADMQEVSKYLKQIEHENELTQADIKSALECYEKHYYNFTLDDIEQLSGIRIERNKRNGRKQEQHIKLMNFVRDEINQNTNWRKGNGRPKGSTGGNKQQLVYAWQQQHPEGRKVDCQRDTGLDPKTIRKWWNTTPSAPQIDQQSAQQAHKNVLDSLPDLIREAEEQRQREEQRAKALKRMFVFRNNRGELK